jgi:poly-gamma-glutamate synthesis protein (capsule biosynthesis protein)
MADAKVKLACWLYARKHRATFSAARPLEGNAATMGPDERYWWGYKYYFGPIEEPEPGSNLREYFRDQDLSVAPPEGFSETAGMTLCAGGDLLAYAGIRPDNTPGLWDDVRDFYFSGDLAYANLEAPIAYKLPPQYLPKSIMEHGAMNGTPAMFDRIVEGGKAVNYFSTANNHSLDMGEEGLRETLDFLDARGYPHVGTARSPEERDKVAMVEKGGVKTAFVSFTFGTNTSKIPEGKSYLVNSLRLNKPDEDLSPLAAQIAAARAAGADFVIALLHWSLEFETYPATNIVAMGHRVAELGVDAIIGNHPHNVQPIEKYACADKATVAAREVLIFYALGDLLSLHRTIPDSRLACLVRLRLSKGTMAGNTAGGAGAPAGAAAPRVTKLEALPVYLFQKKRGGDCVDYRILDFRKLAAELRSGLDRHGMSARMRREFFRLEKLMNEVLGPALK